MLAHRYALKLGWANTSAMLRTLTGKQWIEMSAYAELEPFDEVRDDYRIASIVQAIFNTNLGKGQKPFTLDDVRLKFGGVEEPKKQQSPEEQLAIMKLWAAAQAMADDES